MLERRMVGALMVLVGMIAVFSGGTAWLIEETNLVYTSVEARTTGGTSPLLPIGVALTLAGGVVLLLSPARRLG